MSNQHLGHALDRAAKDYVELLEKCASLEEQYDALKQERDRYSASLFAHHEISTLSDEAVRESIGGTCQICTRAQREYEYLNPGIGSSSRGQDAARRALLHFDADGIVRSG